MDEEFVDGIMTGKLSFSKYSYVPYATVEGLKCPVILLGKSKDKRNEYKGRRVRIPKSSLFFPDKRYGILGSKDYTFPDANQDISDFIPALETVLERIDVNAKNNILEEKDEDSFLYDASTFDLSNGRIFFLRLTRYRKDNRSIADSFDDWMRIPYTRLASCFRSGAAIELEGYITHFAKQFLIDYSAYVLRDGKAEEATKLISDNPNLRVIDPQLGKALSDPLYMEALCRRIEKVVAPSFQRQ